MRFSLGLIILLLSPLIYADPCTKCLDSRLPSMGDSATMLLKDIDQVVRAEVGIGETHFSSQTNGVWYQKGLPYQLNLNSASYNIGIVAKISDVDKLERRRHGLRRQLCCLQRQSR